MKTTVFIALLMLASCGSDFQSVWLEPMPPSPIVAADEDPRFCAHEYPIDKEPESCESNSAGDCCSWENVESEEGNCRYDYCSFYDSSDCSWELQYKECQQEE